VFRPDEPPRPPTNGATHANGATHGTRPRGVHGRGRLRLGLRRR
jgi:hypothetical protein